MGRPSTRMVRKDASARVNPYGLVARSVIVDDWRAGCPPGEPVHLQASVARCGKTCLCSLWLCSFRSIPQHPTREAWFSVTHQLPLLRSASEEMRRICSQPKPESKSRLRFPGPFEQGGSTAPGVDSTSVDADRTSLKSGKVCRGRFAKQEPKWIFKKGGIPPSRTPVTLPIRPRLHRPSATGTSTGTRVQSGDIR
jgi:hypothetical protein